MEQTGHTCWRRRRHARNQWRTCCTSDRSRAHHQAGTRLGWARNRLAGPPTPRHRHATQPFLCVATRQRPTGRGIYQTTSPTMFRHSSLVRARCSHSGVWCLAVCVCVWWWWWWGGLQKSAGTFGNGLPGDGVSTYGFPSPSPSVPFHLLARCAYSSGATFIACRFLNALLSTVTMLFPPSVRNISWVAPKKSPVNKTARHAGLHSSAMSDHCPPPTHTHTAQDPNAQLRARAAAVWGVMLSGDITGTDAGDLVVLQPKRSHPPQVFHRRNAGEGKAGQSCTASQPPKVRQRHTTLKHRTGPVARIDEHNGRKPVCQQRV